MARRISCALGALGIAFWCALLVGLTAGVKPLAGQEWAVNLIRGALVVDLIGIGIVFVVPRGRRLLPALLNTVPLLYMFALLVILLSQVDL